MSNHTVNRYSDEELQEFKVLIEDKLAIAKQELDFMREQILELNENSSDQQGGDWFDDSSIHTELEMLNNMVIRQQQFVRNLENALIRVQNKTYGICTVSGELIEKKRLLLVPHATKSVAAKEEKENRPAAPVILEKMIEEPELKKVVADTKTPKVITKVIRKPLKPSNKPKVVEEEEDFDWDMLDDDTDSGGDDYNPSILNVNFEELPDDDGMD